MSRGDPVEFVRRLQSNDQPQRVGNRVQLEAFEIEEDHCQVGADNAILGAIYAAPGINNHWRFTRLTLGFTAVPAAAIVVQVTDTITVWQMPVAGMGPYSFEFSTVRWASNQDLAVTVPAAGAGVVAYFNVHGLRAERDIYS